ncbi:RsfA family transcriptional regulator [Bacillus sp. CGMCC 1.16607]|uniref:RsfA family transcriptional regulator n=1 Tax=Bacillus sp. CGMCC 1.16607 TaxID=3351842 RepID=UPI00363FE102
MSSTRQDAWNQDEDLFLAEVVLRHIREGGTQLQAFEEVGKQLSRTSAACGFRWNSYVRKQYKSGIELAKKQRKESKKQVTEIDDQTDILNQDDVEKQDNLMEESFGISFKHVLSFLTTLHEKAEASLYEKAEKLKQTEKINDLEKKIYYLAAENEKLTSELKTIEKDYRSLIEIMERARKMVVLQEEDRHPKVKFQMDKNGNLERI